MKILIFWCVSVMGCQAGPTDATAALEAARAAWGITVPVRIAWIAMNPCDVTDRRNPPQMAITERPWSGIEGGPITYGEPTINLNSNCDWSRWDLKRVLMHEYGHALGLEGHSQDPRSVMYKTVDFDRVQVITAQDRASLALIQPQEAKERI